MNAKIKKVMPENRVHRLGNIEEKYAKHSLENLVHK